MATKEQVKGVTVSRERPAVVHLPHAPENQHLTHAEFVRRRKIQKDAAAIGEAARIKAIKEAGLESSGSDTAAEQSAAENKVEKLRAQLAAVQEKLGKKPDSAKLQKEVEKISELLEKAEAEVG